MKSNQGSHECTCGICVPDFELKALDGEVPVLTEPKPERKAEIRQASLRRVGPFIVADHVVPMLN